MVAEKVEFFESIAEIARAQGIARRTAQDHALKAGFPKKTKRGYPKAAVLAYFAGLGRRKSEEGNGHDPAYAKVRHDLDRAKLELQRHKVAVLTQEYMRRSDAEEACLDIAHAFKRGHEEMIDALSLELGGLDPPQIAEKLTERFRRLHESVAAQIVAAMQQK